MNSSRRVASACAAVLAVTLAGPLHAESTEAAKIRELEKKLERSLELIEQLAAKIKHIEQASAGLGDAQTKTAAQAAKIEAIEKHVSEIGGNLSRRASEDGLPMHGFADVGILKSGESNRAAKGRKGAVLGMFDLYLTPRFGDRVKTLIELAFEAEQDGSTAADLERMQIGYTFGDAATAWLGRFHTPYGYWNTAFHHGAQIQTAIQRPRFLDFEHDGGILPAHTTGIWLSGSWGLERGRLGYDVFAGNAPQINGVAAGSALGTAGIFSPAVNAGTYGGSGNLNLRHVGSTSHRTSTGFNAWFEPDAWYGLRLGVHGLRAEVVDDAAAVNRTLLGMTGAYATYHPADSWEVLGEYYRFRNQDRSGGTGNHGSWAGFAQVGYTAGKWTPFARAERARLDQTDNYFGVQANGRSYARLAAGLRYDVDPKAALKIELHSTRQEDLGPGVSDTYPEIRLQYAIRF
ncbi:MAG: hypothetical protein HZC24_10855 [Rhodocyclales bacterium]|nr:hypothetical protein [Rhodocyclales bacterium]